MQPEFLAAVIYLENSNWLEQLVQSIPGGEAYQQGLKSLVNGYCFPMALEGTVFHLGGEWRYKYFKVGRSQGIGAIKPEVAKYVSSQGLVHDPQTGEQVNIASYMIPFLLPSNEWNTEFLAAHLEAARNPRDPILLWPDNVSKSDYSSENALRLMVAYHYNVDNLNGWNNPNHAAYGAATAVYQFMPHVNKLLR